MKLERGALHVWFARRLASYRGVFTFVMVNVGGCMDLPTARLFLSRIFSG